MEINTANDLYNVAKEICIGMTLTKGEIIGYPPLLRLPRVVCADGWSVSIQAGTCFYSTPRSDFASNYAAFELGYPSEREPLLDEWSEENRLDENAELDYTQSIYPFTPTEVVDAVLEKHGGIARLGK